MCITQYNSYYEHMDIHVHTTQHGLTTVTITYRDLVLQVHSTQRVNVRVYTQEHTHLVCVRLIAVCEDDYQTWTVLRYTFHVTRRLRIEINKELSSSFYYYDTHFPRREVFQQYEDSKLPIQESGKQDLSKSERVTHTSNTPTVYALYRGLRGAISGRNDRGEPQIPRSHNDRGTPQTPRSHNDRGAPQTPRSHNDTGAPQTPTQESQPWDRSKSALV